MIKIDKGPSPQELINAATPLVNMNNASYDANPANYVSKGFEITEDFKSDTVRNQLKAKQFNKCCFSEAKFLGDYPHVEHFRPKGRVDLIGTKTQLYPGYYWLAYDWDNLFYCKQIINTSYKRNFFPLANENERNSNHNDNHVEQNIFIDPGKENPRDYITFYKDEPTPRNVKGDINIKYLGLRHPHFVEARAKRYAELSGLKEQVDIGVAMGIVVTHPVLAANLRILRNSIKPEAEFSSMAIDLLTGWPHL
jgi:uncharacterized protein (TIGR02646 family)